MTLRRPPRAFSLIEVTMAIGIAAFCLVAIFALLPTGLNTNQASVQQTIAAGIASGIVADLRATPVTAAGGNLSPRYQLNPDTKVDMSDVYFKEDGSSSQGDGSVSATTADFRATIKIIPPDTPPGPTQVYIKIAWPGAAPKPTNFFEVVTALDRNR
jgi:uncharacterized protein (TIGR02598 family)